MLNSSDVPATDAQEHGDIHFDAIRNTRDLGGYLAADGRLIVKGRLLRGANPAMASAADIAKLKNYRLDVVLDFRSETEKHATEANFASAFNWVADPVMVPTRPCPGRDARDQAPASRAASASTTRPARPSMRAPRRLGRHGCGR